jgi:hypothetical protein
MGKYIVLPDGHRSLMAAFLCSAWNWSAEEVLHQASFKQETLNEIPEHFGMGKPLPSDALLEVMSADKDNIYMRHVAFDPDLKTTETSGDHLVTSTGFVG